MINLLFRGATSGVDCFRIILKRPYATILLSGTERTDATGCSHEVGNCVAEHSAPDSWGIEGGGGPAVEVVVRCDGRRGPGTVLRKRFLWTLIGPVFGAHHGKLPPQV